MRKIIVTEENFNRVLETLQKVCNKHKMFRFYRVLSEDMTEQKEYRRNPIGFRTKIKKCNYRNGKWKYKRVKRFFSYSNYVRVTKHHFREAFEYNKNSYDAKYSYPKMKSLIHLDLSGFSALVISEGDKIQFLPFGGFIVWTDNDYTRFENPLVIYKEIFIPNFFRGKIVDLEEENATRDMEWEKEEEAAWQSKFYLEE